MNVRMQSHACIYYSSVKINLNGTTSYWAHFVHLTLRQKQCKWCMFNSIFELFRPKVVLFVRTGPTGFSFHYGFHSPWFRLQVKFCAFRGEFFCRLWNWFDLLLVFLTLHQHLFAFYFLNREHMLFFQPVSHKNANLPMIWGNPTVIGHFLLQQSWKSKGGPLQNPSNVISNKTLLIY